jgi:hypothetical protein
MEEERGRPGGIQRGHNFLSDDPAFADSRGDQATALLPAIHNQIDGARKGNRHAVGEAVRKSKQGFGFYANYLGWGRVIHAKT